MQSFHLPRVGMWPGNRRFLLLGIFGEEASSATRCGFGLCGTKPAAHWGQKDPLTIPECSGYRFSLKFPASPNTHISMVYKPVGSQWLSPQVVLVLYTIYLLHCQDSVGVCVLVNAPRSPCLQLRMYLWCCEIQSQPKRITIQQASHRVKPRLMFVLHTHTHLWPIIGQLPVLHRTFLHQHYALVSGQTSEQQAKSSIFKPRASYLVWQKWLVELQLYKIVFLQLTWMQEQSCVLSSSLLPASAAYHSIVTHTCHKPHL